jgi:hypothetical protein
MEDFQAWQSYPHMRLWFNKLYLAERLGYDCGPGGIPPKKSNFYCVRPIYNLDGMGVGARKQWIDAEDRGGVEPGYFWCEWFDGEQYSASYKSSDWFSYDQISCYKADRDVDRLFRFKRWTRSERSFTIPVTIEEEIMMSGVEVVNIEMIGDKLIEIHFRNTPDPDYNELIPVWSDEKEVIDIYGKMGYNFIEAPDNSNGHLTTQRLGFMVK